MLVVNCRNPSSAEKETLEALSKMQGIAIVGYTILEEQREREVDIILITPVRAVAIEVKAPKIGTPYQGELTPTTNGAWKINGNAASFYGGSNPLNQARTSAKIFASFLRSNMTNTPFIQVAVSVSGEKRGLTMKEPLLAGLTAVFLASATEEGLGLMRKKPIPLKMVEEILTTMNLGAIQPSSDRVKNEWRNAENIHKHLKRDESPSSPLTMTKREKATQMHSPFFSLTKQASEILNSAIVIFLLVWFLYTSGILEYVILAFDNISTWIDHLLLE